MFLLQRGSPLLAQSRHPDRVGECPLLGVKRTSKFKSVTSAFDPKPTLDPIQYSRLALRRLQREQAPKSPFVFTSERGAPFTTAGFARMVERAGIEARLGFKVHPHMLRHACGYALANRGHDTRALQAYLGHRNIQHTVRYTELSPLRFKDFWRS
jgi:hypothetical protein